MELYMLSAVSLDTLPIPQSRQLQEYSLWGPIGEPLACSPYHLVVGP